MRMMLKATLDTAKSNEAVKTGNLSKVISTFTERAKPEASYFTVAGGRRCALFFFDMKDASQMPPLAEDMFMTLGAELEFTPVMNTDELKAGLGALMAQK